MEVWEVGGSCSGFSIQAVLKKSTNYIKAKVLAPWTK